MRRRNWTLSSFERIGFVAGNVLNKSKSVALLFAGSAALLISCAGEDRQAKDNNEHLLTQKSDTLTVISSENGLKAYRFYTPLMERYEFAREPYMEFREGIDVTTYKDSTSTVESTIVADYAIFYEKRKLWEARGNVVVVGDNGQTLYTQQLFWNQITKKIYSNVDSKVVDKDGTTIGEGFESDEAFKQWLVRRPKLKMAVKTSPADTAAREDEPVYRHQKRAPQDPDGKMVRTAGPVYRSGGPERETAGQKD